MKRWLLTMATVLLTTHVSAVQAQDIRPFQPDSMEKLIDSHKGKPFVLMVWSLDCVYCQASMKNLVQEKRKRPNLRIVTLSTDSATDEQTLALIKQKLQSNGMSGDAWAYGDAPPEQLNYAVDPEWYGEKPRSYWFNAKGERVAYSGTITPAVIEKFNGKPTSAPR